MKRKRKNMKNIRDFFRDNGIFIFVLLLIIVFNFVFPKYFIKSGSMEPELKTGAIVWINPYDRKPDINDIAAYKKGENITVHRVIDKNKNGYTFKGDANAIADANTISQDEVKGTILFKINFLAPLIRKIFHINNI